ncbi:Peptidoglycan recognition protein 1 [Pseudolycoriella hygida]|uniref:Peptidoglycan recognition protein 1 n=1 Tax=Pseudolycoriella hygida TaxID=35572 RepID=A0A9Q0MZ14_9DIPT|nr:Peptidoglycan recognition protein 1 [Pseudolycoriella hygida]
MDRKNENVESTPGEKDDKIVIIVPVVIKHIFAENYSRSHGSQKDKRFDSHGGTVKRNKEVTLWKDNFFRRRHLIIVTVMVAILIIITATLCGFYVNSPQRVVPIEFNETDETDEPIESDDYELISREEYDAIPRRGVLEPLDLPVKYVIIAHTDGNNCTNIYQCKEIARLIQKYHMDVLGWDDIGLNFMVGGDGRVYEGCGYEEGAHTLRYNFDSVCISLMGNFDAYEPTKQQLQTVQNFIKDGVKRSVIQRDYVLYAHGQLTGGASPGQHVYNKIVNWLHWSAEVIPKE